MLKTGILRPRRKSEVESDTYGGTKFSPNICSNDDEATAVLGHTSQRTWVENISLKIIFDDVTVWAHIWASSILFQNSYGCP